jgi:oligoendopeptidase F
MSTAPAFTSRAEIPDRYKWSLTRIFPDWDAWRAAYDELARKSTDYAALRGTLAQGPARLLAAYRLDDELGQLAYKVWYFASLRHDEDLRDNEVGARRQEVQILLARWRQAAAWFAPELLAIPLATVRAWMDADADLAVYRFAVEDLYRQQEHVLDEKGEHLLSLASRLTSVPHDAYAALSTADVEFPKIRLRSGAELTVTPGQYRAVVTTNRDQSDRAEAWRALSQLYADSANTYAALYDGVLQRDWFLAQARGFASTLEAALHGNDIPTSVVDNLITATRAGLAPLQRYHRLRKRALGLASYHPYDTAIPIVEIDRSYPYDTVLDGLEASVAPLGEPYRAELRTALHGGYIDVYENPGKQSGAYSAPVYGVHPYMLMNYNDTLDAAFTLAHEMGHTMHTLLAHRHQPFVYAGYTIFVAEVPSTLNESLFLEHLLANATDPRERAVLLEHAIDAIVGTFYGQVMFADFELSAHRMVERGEAVTAEALAELYSALLRTWHGDVVEYPELARTSWARVPHFFASPYYVYQYATCFASSAQLARQLTTGSPDARAAALSRYLGLLSAGGNDHPMALLRRAGVDLARPEPVQAVVAQMDLLVSRLEGELAALGLLAAE